MKGESVKGCRFLREGWLTGNRDEKGSEKAH
jgi:hypothetical protein